MVTPAEGAMCHTPDSISTNTAMAVASTLAHGAGYLMVTAATAWVVFTKVGVGIIRSAWVNLDLIWAVALIATGILISTNGTRFKVNKPDYTEKADSRVSYEDIGGLERDLRSVREMVEIPLRYREIFDRLGIQAPKGLLLYGPPGTGKTLLARAIASEAKLHHQDQRTEIIQNYGDS
jgi:ATP-dependent Zn protease